MHTVILRARSLTLSAFPDFLPRRRRALSSAILSLASLPLASTLRWTRPKCFPPRAPLLSLSHLLTFPGCTGNSSCNSKLLGSAIGDRKWCEHLPSKMVVKASTPNQAIGRYGDAHAAFTLLRSCTGWAKIFYSCRTVPLNDNLGRGLNLPTLRANAGPLGRSPPSLACAGGDRVDRHNAARDVVARDSWSILPIKEKPLPPPSSFRPFWPRPLPPSRHPLAISPSAMPSALQLVNS